MTSTYKILVAHYQSSVISGAENSIADLAAQIDPRFQITMLVPDEGQLAGFYRKRGVQVWVKSVETPRRLFPGLHRLQSWSLARDLKKYGFDAVLCNTFPAASRVGTACRQAHLPYAIFMRDYIADHPLHRRILHQANQLFAISKDVINQHARMVDPQKFRLAYNSINPEPILTRLEAHRTSGKRLLPFAYETPVVGLVGRITPYKQPDLFIRAVPHIIQQVPEARFVIVGAAQQREKAYEDSLKELAAQFGMADRIAFLGHRRDAIEVTSEFTISCLASGREPLGRVILEAQLMGIPVVVPDMGGPAEIVEDEVTGLNFSSRGGDAEVAFAQQIIRLLKDPKLRACLAERARERVLATFASHKHVQVQEELIEQLCVSKNGTEK